ncbi:glycerophosphodiester phosphodiesterase family protein [Motilimonas pumila]|uniref:glycerophosphodiester phosphodiesterase n=1 Tax=Motilimonas pumila TaxID=2303987 RepID=A0A418YFV8_9GAMM|nr:glycerophosphodiester phosphodiesterase family protein [Motilimonas pumila]RJG48201.1 glycerophosphodiester phosphodiesterase [Motilimonas pumila]
MRYQSAIQPALILASSVLLVACNDSDSAKTVEQTADMAIAAATAQTAHVSLGPRPSYLISKMQPSTLKSQLEQCASGPFYRSEFSIGHRGAPLQFPEHTKESYQAAIEMGAGVLECDVTFTKDKELVCRHSQCDLATTTNILAIPELASKCSVPFTPADPINGISASATCCTSDITLAEFKMLQGKMDASNADATAAEDFLAGTAPWRTDLYSGSGTLMTHAESIAMFKAAGVKMTPELKSANVDMPFDGFTQQDYAQKLLDEYIAADIQPEDVYPQSFNLEDVKYWITANPDFAKQAVFLDGRYDDPAFNPHDPTSWSPTMDELVNDGIKVIAPPLWVLLSLDANNNIVPSEYAKAAKEADLGIITWTLERSGLLSQGNGGWYYQTVSDAIDNEGDTYEVLDVLAQQVGVLGVFTDWPATVTYYANCVSK